MREAKSAYAILMMKYICFDTGVNIYCIKYKIKERGRRGEKGWGWSYYLYKAKSIRETFPRIEQIVSRYYSGGETVERFLGETVFIECDKILI